MSYHSLFYSYHNQSPWTDNGNANLAFPLIVAMTEMEISNSQIRGIINKEQEKNPVSLLPEKENMELITKDNWKDFIGNKDKYLELTVFFQMLIDQEPENIHYYFSELADGLYTNDFYSLIRLAYALESGQKEEVARAFGFLAASYQPVHFQLPERETKVFIEQITDLQPKQSSYSFKEESLYQRICEIAEGNNYLNDFAKLEEENLNIFTLRALVIRLARETNEEMMKTLFCAVHAFRVVSPMFKDMGEAIQQFYMVMQAAYLSLGCPKLEPAELSADKNWPLIFQLSGVSKKISNIFFIYSCYRENQFAESSIYSEMAYHVIHNEIQVDR